VFSRKTGEVDMKRLRAWFVLSVAAVAVLGSSSCGRREKPAKPPEITMVVHGGAGTISRAKMTPERERVYRAALTEALGKGLEILRNRGTALDAVEAAVRVLEDSPLFNAGKGAVFTSEGKNELDASIMDGKTLKAGAVGSVTTVKNPISAARAVMEKSKHVLLAGRGADLFAAEKGLEIVPPEYYFEQRRWDELLKAKEEQGASVVNPEASAVSFGTVGALALDGEGNLAAGTSTGGLTNKMPGRLGDTPIIGAGTYANNKTCAVSGTGQGEYFMRLLIAYDVSAHMEYEGMSLSDAAEKVIREKLTGLGGTGGLIALDRSGSIAMPFNTEGMYRGWVKEDGEVHILMYEDGEDRP
jgi:beta-aspartyl-peptidase (threonine type)